MPFIIYGKTSIQKSTNVEEHIKKNYKKRDSNWNPFFVIYKG
jgi:hypothetical protein